MPKPGTDIAAVRKEQAKTGALERRTVRGVDAEAEAAPSGKKRIAGYGSLYDTPTKIEGFWDEWVEEVAQGAWTRTIEESDRIVASHNHDLNILLGATDSGTLELSDDDTGLYYEIDVNPEDPFALAVWSRVKRGDVSGASVWFRVVRQEWQEATEDEPEKRIILDADLYEVGPVVMPAFVDTTAEAASRLLTRPGELLDATLDDHAEELRKLRELIADRDDLIKRYRAELAWHRAQLDKAFRS